MHKIMNCLKFYKQNSYSIYHHNPIADRVPRFAERRSLRAAPPKKLSFSQVPMILDASEITVLCNNGRNPP